MFQALISKLLLTDSKDKSFSLTMTVLAFSVINFKLILSGVTIGSLQLSVFSGVDYAAALAAITTLHLGNKAVNNHKELESTKIEKDSQ